MSCISQLYVLYKLVKLYVFLLYFTLRTVLQSFYTQLRPIIISTSFLNRKGQYILYILSMVLLNFNDK